MLPLHIYKCSHLSLRNKYGKVIKPLQYQSTVAPGTVARVEPNIKWFGEFSSTVRLSKLGIGGPGCVWRVFGVSLLCGTDGKTKAKDLQTWGWAQALLYQCFGLLLLVYSSKPGLFFLLGASSGPYPSVCVLRSKGSL